MESALGRGLDSLIARTIEADDSQLVDIPLEEIRVNPGQPRRFFDKEALDGLAASIARHGVLQPIAVSRTANGYQLVAGERRWRASKLAGRASIPAVVVDAEGVKSLELALIENIQREDLGPMEESAAYQQLLVQTGLTHQKLADRLGKSRAAVTNSLRLLELPEDVQEMLREGLLSAGQARAVLGSESLSVMSSLAAKAVRETWSVREVERQVRDQKRSPKRTKVAKPRNHVGKAKQYEEQLRNLYGTKVAIDDNDGVGEVRLRFYSGDDRDRLLHQLLSARTAD